MLSELPIVGQKYKLAGWFVTLNLVCQCEAQPSLLLVGGVGAAIKCPACHAAFQLQGLQSDVESGQMRFQIGVGHAAPDVASPLVGG